MAVENLPLAPLPQLLAVDISVAEDIRIVSDGITYAGIILKQRAKQAQTDYVLAQLATAALSTNSTSLSPQTMAQVIDTLEKQPDILPPEMLDAEHIRMYAKNCWSIFEKLVDLADNKEEANRLIQGAIAQPMGIVEHNALAQLLIDRIGIVLADTLFKYLNAVEASCRSQQPGSAQVHNVRLASKVFNHALDANNALAEAMSIELCSFCLSYTQVKDATDLYRRVLSANRKDH
ncbi:hypothetical protein IWW36_001373 [Coemansia brasiliensis]|uniref:Uncharacterized protein n=1 Tax=Coemansia brasiliensis TaxID=2650707 RepID=A0A9W8I961_9FUNG|nr:hypothetical protein IWW36_001373 [Coemansia brasiliensis]